MPPMCVRSSDSPSHAFRRKKDSSLHIAARLVRDGRAEALVSAGNTGAVMTVARFVIGSLTLSRPPGAHLRLSEHERNVSCFWMSAPTSIASPSTPAQFAVMGEIYSRAIWGTKSPARSTTFHRRGGKKGNDLTRAASAA